MKKIKRETLIIFEFIIGILLISSVFLGYDRKDSSKNFIIKYADRIILKDSIYYSIDSLKGYYTDVSIRLDSDSSYTIVYWGDRDSWLWDFKLDYYYTVDIPYNRSKGIDVSKDIQILNLLKK